MAPMPDDRGRAAVSEYFTKEVFPKHTLVEVNPQTGRTHQIRVHLAFLGCPIVGDTVYGFKKPSLPLRRHFLHATSLSIQLEGETGQRTFTSPIPPDLEQVLDDLRKP
jgi:23S rRNA pseudouridine1911/1915/1917 synthase